MGVLSGTMFWTRRHRLGLAGAVIAFAFLLDLFTEDAAIRGSSRAVNGVFSLLPTAALLWFRFEAWRMRGGRETVKPPG